MTGSTRSSHDLDSRRRRALFRAWRRGMKEMDLLLGGFADAYIGDLDERDLADFEVLMDVPDDQLFAWITGRQPAELTHRSPVFNAIVEFHMRGHAES